MNFRLFITNVLKHTKIFLIWILIGIILSVIVYFLQTPIYVTSTKWYIQKVSTENIVSKLSNSFDKEAVGNFSSTKLKIKAINTTAIDAAVLMSSDIIKEIIKRANLIDQSGHYISVDEFKKSFVIKPDKKYPFITLKYFSKDPQKAYDVLIIAEDVFKEKNISAEGKKVQKNKKFLEKQIAIIKDNTDKAATELRNYEKEAKIIDINAEAVDQQTRVAQLKSSLASYNADLEETRTKIVDLKQKLGINTTIQALNKTTIGSDKDITILKDELINKNTKLISLQSKYTDKHFSIIQLKEEINEIEKLIEKRQKELIGKEIPSEKIEEVKKLKYLMIDDLIRYTTQEVAMKARLDALQKTINKYETDLQILPSKKLSFKSYEFDNKFQQDLLKKVKLSYENVRIQETFTNNTVNIMKLHNPKVPIKPKYPNIFLNISIALFLSLIFAYINVLVIDSLDNKINIAEQLKSVSKYNFLGRVLVNNKPYDKYIQKSDNYKDNVLSAYRDIAVNLLFTKEDQNINTITLISSKYNSANSLALINLATIIAEFQEKVLLVEMNLQKPDLDQMLSLEPSKDGLTDYLTNKITSLDKIIQKLPFNDLFYLPAGSKPINSVDLIESNKMNQLIDYLSNNYDFVVFNLPDFNDHSETLLLAKKIGINILVANGSFTSRTDFIRMQNILDASNIKVLGSLFVQSDKY
ncbi:MAG: hypothetical protein AB1782_07100 [Cyanobacteriota bacterium]